MRHRSAVVLATLTLTLSTPALADPDPEPGSEPKPVRMPWPGPEPDPAPDPEPDAESDSDPRPAPTPPIPYRDLPKYLPYYADEPIPTGYRLVDHPDWALTGTGIGFLAATWLTSIAAAVALDRAPDGSDDPNFDDDYAPLFVPVVGPFAAIATADASGTGAGILALDGVVQLAATGLILAGLVWPDRELEKKETLWTLMPTASAEGGGLSLGGHF